MRGMTGIHNFPQVILTLSCSVWSCIKSENTLKELAAIEVSFLCFSQISTLTASDPLGPGLAL